MQDGIAENNLTSNIKYIPTGYLWLNRPHKKQKWKRVFSCLYSSPALTYLVWWANKHENQIRGFVLLNDYDVVHYLANSICIKPVSTASRRILAVLHAPSLFFPFLELTSAVLQPYCIKIRHVLPRDIAAEAAVLVLGCIVALSYCVAWEVLLHEWG